MNRPLVIACTVAVLASGGCAARPADPRAVGDKTLLCAGRVTREQAEQAVGSSVSNLIELNTFTDGRKAGECTLADDDGAVLDVSVVHDPRGQALAGILHDLVSSANYDGDGSSAVAGEASHTEAYAAIDNDDYAQVLLNSGSSAARRDAALALVRAVAAQSKGLK